MTKENKELKKKNMFLELFERISTLPRLKMFELSISWLKGFATKVEFFEKKRRNNEQ